MGSGSRDRRFTPFGEFGGVRLRSGEGAGPPIWSHAGRGQALLEPLKRGLALTTADGLTPNMVR